MTAVDIPPHLIEEIRKGNCVAFVGAGFSAAAKLPSWERLLHDIAAVNEVDEETRAHVATLVARGSAHAYDQAAQALEDHLGRDRFTRHLKTLLGRPALPRGMLDRVAWLQGIPFRAILTTNFDGVLEGDPPGSAAFRGVLRPTGHRWWDEAFWGTRRGAFTIKLHGDLLAEDAANNVVLTRRAYRRRLYGDPAYITFLRAVFSIHTVLYLGFSFEDAYLNELRSEVLSLLGHGPGDAPVAYAVVNDVTAATRGHFRAHEGIEVLTYDTREKTDFSGFDRILKALYDATNPLPHFGRLLAGRRLLWLDPLPDNNAEGFRFLSEAAEQGNAGSAALDKVGNPDEALALLSRPDVGYDLVISHWGFGGDADKDASVVRLLVGMRARDIRVPVLIFSIERDADRRKRLALSLGAQGYAFTWPDLFRDIDRILTSATETR